MNTSTIKKFNKKEIGLAKKIINDQFKKLPDELEINGIKYNREKQKGISENSINNDTTLTYVHLQRYKNHSQALEVEIEILVKVDLKNSKAEFFLDKINAITFIDNVLINENTQNSQEISLNIGHCSYLIKTDGTLKLVSNQKKKIQELVVIKSNIELFEPHNELSDETKKHFAEAKKVYSINPRWCVPIFRVILEINLIDYFKNFETNNNKNDNAGLDAPRYQLGNFWCNNEVDKSVFATQTPFYTPELKFHLILLRDFCNDAVHASGKIGNKEEYKSKIAKIFNLINDLCVFLINTKKQGLQILKKIKEIGF